MKIGMVRKKRVLNWAGMIERIKPGMRILNEGLLDGMSIIGVKFKNITDYNDGCDGRCGTLCNRSRHS